MNLNYLLVPIRKYLKKDEDMWKRQGAKLKYLPMVKAGTYSNKNKDSNGFQTTE